METIDVCPFNMLSNIIIVSIVCFMFYNFLNNRTINIENFSPTKKITYSIDGHDFTYNPNLNN